MAKLFPKSPFGTPPKVTPPSVVFKQPPKTPLFPAHPFGKSPAQVAEDKRKAAAAAKAKKDAAAKAAAAAGAGGSTTATSATTAAGGGWGKVGTPYAYQNSEFDKRIASQNPWFPAITSRGSIVQNREWLKDSGLTNQKYPFKLQFLYNPSEIAYSYVFNTDNAAPENMTAYQASAALLMPGSTTMSIDLLFDRTYDVLDGKIPTGCLDDVSAFQQMVGIVGGQGNLLLTPLDVYFGAAVDVTKFIVSPENYPRPISTLHFHGYVTGASVTYTHFTHDMTPVRAVIHMDMVEIITSKEVWKNQYNKAADGTSNTTDPTKPTDPAAPKPGDNTPKDAGKVATLTLRIANIKKALAGNLTIKQHDTLTAELKKDEAALAAASETPAQTAAKKAKDAADKKKKKDAADAARKRAQSHHLPGGLTLK